MHCEGYTPKSLTHLVSNYGFKVLKIKRISWRGVYSFALIAQKGSIQSSKQDFEKATERFLGNFTVDRSESERKLLEVWLDIYREQVKVGWAQDG